MPAKKKMPLAQAAQTFQKAKTEAFQIPKEKPITQCRFDVIVDPTLHANAKLLFVVLTDLSLTPEICDSDRAVCLEIQSYQDLTGLPVDKIRRAADQLEKKGYLKIRRDPHGSDGYQIVR